MILIKLCSLTRVKLTVFYKQLMTKTYTFQTKRILNIVVYHYRLSNNSHVTHTHTQIVTCAQQSLLIHSDTKISK